MRCRAICLTRTTVYLGPTGLAVTPTAQPAKPHHPWRDFGDTHIARKPHPAGIYSRRRAEPAHRIYAGRGPLGLAPRAARLGCGSALGGRQQRRAIP